MTTTTSNTKEEITRVFNQAMEQLVKVISSFDEQGFNRIPFKGSWTAGQVAEHLAKSISGIPGLLVTETKDVERDPFEKCVVINSIFLNFEEKYQAPSFTLPSDTPKQVLHFTNVFTRTSDEINHLMRERDMTKVFTRFPFPQVGELTGWEWICFAASHSIRHTRQLENIFNHVNP